MRRYLVLVALVLTALVLGGAVIYSSTQTSAPSRSWCDPDTWDGGNVPGAADEARVVSEVVVDCDWTVGAVTIEEGGSLRWAGTATLTVDASAGGDATGRVEVFGELEMRPAVDERHVLAFAGLDETTMVGGDAGMMSDPGGLHVMGAGELDLDGPDRTAWTRLAAPTVAGDTTLHAIDVDGWQAGDKIAITPTTPGDWQGYSEVTIVAVDGATVTVDTPVGEHTAAAEVLNLTRNIEVTTASGDPSYVMVHPSAGVQHLADAAFTNLGPDVVGRYPLHLHRQADASRGSTFDRLLVLDSGNRAVVPHGSHGTTWTDVVAHRIRRDAFWWDKGQGVDASNDTTWHRAVASDVRTAGTQPRAKFRLAGFELASGFGNRLTDSVAVGVEGAKDSSGFEWLEGAATAGTGEWLFEGNVAHNNARHGIFGWQNTSGVHVISDFTATGNGGWGVSHGAYRNGYLYERLTLEANVSGGVLIHANGRLDGIRFIDVTVSDSPVGFATTRHQQPALAPTYITDPVFVDVDRPLVAGGLNEPDDVIVTGWATCPEFVVDAHPDNSWTVDGLAC